MAINPHDLARLVTAESGLAFTGKRDSNNKDQQVFELVPDGFPASQTFKLRSWAVWRSVETVFTPGAFAGELVAHMGRASPEAKSLFLGVLRAATKDQATVKIQLNGHQIEPHDPLLWEEPWRTVTLSIRRGQLEIDGTADLQTFTKWVGLLASAVLALMPLEAEDLQAPDIEGFPEGARLKVEVNRYERDRRNRAAAIAIHGFSCQGCQRTMAEIYGDVARTLIEVHHITPVSKLDDNYIVNPATDLAPLCPNCHAIVHTQSPPMTIQELRQLLAAK